MAILYNLEPLAAVDLFYGGEKNGVWNGDFIRNEKTRGLVLPPIVREFLENYGYWDLNRNQSSFRLAQPDNIGEICLQTDIGDVPVMVIGFYQDYLVGIRLDTEDLQAAFGKQTDDGVMWSPVANLNFSGILATMFVSLLFQSDDHYAFENAFEMDAALAGQSIDNPQILQTVKKASNAMQLNSARFRPGEGCPEHFSLNFDEENGVFLIVEYDRQGENIICLHAAPQKVFTFEELEQLFNKEFYQNSLHCDYNHALQLQLKMMEYLELEEADPLELSEHYKIAARCCWALGAFDKAVSWYEKGLPAIEDNLEYAPEKAVSYYHAMGNFYMDNRQYDKSDQYYARALDILYEYLPDNVYQIGMIYQSQAQFLVQNKENLDKAIALYDRALEEFKKKPKVCKYDIARTQQLRGDAKRLKKELTK